MIVFLNMQDIVLETDFIFMLSVTFFQPVLVKDLAVIVREFNFELTLIFIEAGCTTAFFLICDIYFGFIKTQKYKMYL